MKLRNCNITQSNMIRYDSLHFNFILLVAVVAPGLHRRCYINLSGTWNRFGHEAVIKIMSVGPPDMYSFHIFCDFHMMSNDVRTKEYTQYFSSFSKSLKFVLGCCFPIFPQMLERFLISLSSFLFFKYLQHFSPINSCPSLCNFLKLDKS